MSDIQRIGLRHDDLSDWESGNPTLVVDETVIIDDIGMIIRGDGGAFNTSYDVVGTLGASDMVNGKYLGEMFMRGGNAVAPSAGFPALCLTDIAKGSAKTVSTTNWYSGFITWLRGQSLVYLEGQTGEAATFSGSVSGSVLTLDTNTANDDLLAALVEYQADYGTYTDWLSGDIDGTTHEITAVNAVARTITFATAPTAGTQNLTIYPHRIAGSTTTARVHSLAGKAMVGAGTTEILGMIMRRDRFQGFGLLSNSTAATSTNVGSLNESMTTGLGGVRSGNVLTDYYDTSVSGNALIGNDGTNGTPRTGPTTHPADYGVHVYYHGGVYAA